MDAGSISPAFPLLPVALKSQGLDPACGATLWRGGSALPQDMAPWGDHWEQGGVPCPSKPGRSRVTPTLDSPVSALAC